MLHNLWSQVAFAIVTVFVVMTKAAPNKSVELAVEPGVNAQKVEENKQENHETVEQGHVDNYEEFSSPDASVNQEHFGFKFDWIYIFE